MSGTLAKALGAVNAIGSIATLLTGGAAVTIGDIGLQDFEVPEFMTPGGAQALTVHKLLGGDRFIDTMGRDDAPLAWRGIMFSSDAATRSDALDALRIAGQPVSLIFGHYHFKVVVQSYAARYRRTNYIDYDIACVVLRDETGAGGSGVSSDLGALIGDDLASGVSALANGVSTVVKTASTALAVAQQAANIAGAFGFRTGGALNAIGQMQSTVGLIGVGITASEGVLNSVASVAANGLGGLVPHAAGLVSATSAAGDLASLTAARGYVGRATANATNGST
jgi:hypothetical protein